VLSTIVELSDQNNEHVEHNNKHYTNETVNKTHNKLLPTKVLQSLEYSPISTKNSLWTSFWIFEAHHVSKSERRNLNLTGFLKW
jgi:hypothetical protein